MVVLRLQRAFFLTGEMPRCYTNKISSGMSCSAPCWRKKVDLVRRGYHANISHCPETRRRANGWSRHGRIKALPNVAVPEFGTLRCVEPKLSPGGWKDRACVARSPFFAPVEFL